MTTRFGEQEIEAGKIITMSDGMIGFSERSFILFNPDNGGPFCWLQSIENPALAFVVVDPVYFVPEYQVKLTREEHDKLLLKTGDEIVLLSVVTMSSDPRLITTNLQGPIVINAACMTAMQLVLENNHACWHQLFAPRVVAAAEEIRRPQPLSPAAYNVSYRYRGMSLAPACP